MLVSNFAIVSLASAAIELNFRVANSHISRIENKVGKTHQVHKRALGSGAGNETVEPLINATLTPSFNFYYGDLFVGQPPQKFEVLLDTASPVSWLYGPRRSYHNATRFFPNQSLTFQEENVTFSAHYGTGIYLGRWVSDIVAAPQFVASSIAFNVSANSTLNSTLDAARNITNATQADFAWNTTMVNVTDLNPTALNNSLTQKNISVAPFSVPFEFGLVSSFVSAAGAPGLLGLGPHNVNAGPQNYLSLPEAYYRYNVTSSPAFSVFLEEKNGKFIFGGVDTKYAQLPFYRYSAGNATRNSSSSSWIASLDSVSFKGKNYTVNSTASLDTGSPVTLFPADIVKKIGKALKFKKHKEYEVYYTNKEKIPQHNITLIVNGGLQLVIPISEFFVPGEYIWLNDGPANVTALGLVGSPTFTLGDAFFRSAYTILDPSNGDVLISKRSGVLSNTSNASNASSIIPIARIMKNSSAIVDLSNNVRQSSSKTTSGKKGMKGKTSTAAPYAPYNNAYVGTVGSSIGASVSSADAVAATATGSTTSSKGKNDAVSNSISSAAILLIAAPMFLLI